MPAPAEVEAGVAEKGDEEESADGTRRWRGRRGRRRGVRGSQVAREPQANLSIDASAEAVEDQDLLDTPERGAPGGIASLHVPPEPAVPQRVQTPRTPRGFGGPSRISAFADADAMEHPEPAPHTAAAPVAIVLPGESISKYGGASAAADATPIASAQSTKPTRPVNFVPAKPSTLVELSSDWDGGAVLPGESLSRYRGERQEHVAAAPVELAGIHEAELYPETHEPEGPELDGNEPGVDEPALHESDVTFLTAAGEETAVRGLPEAEPEAQPEPVYLDSLVAGADLAAPETVAEALPHAEHEHEYEPENASASHKVDPGAPSELRIPGLANLTAALGFTSHEEPAHVEESAPAEHHEPAEHDQPVEHTEHLEYGEPVEHVAHEEPFVEPHDLDGNSFALEYEDHAPRLSAAAEAQQRDADAIARASAHAEVVGQMQGFAPGSGLLEEEIIDEDEYDFAPIEAHGDDDMEELEEETLDHRHEVQVEPSVLGDAVRESHLNQRLDVKPETGEPEAEDAEGEEEASFGYDEIDEDEDEGGVIAAQPAQADAPRREGGGRGRANGRGRHGAPGGDGRGRRASSQLSNLPVISELLKQGQEILVQIAKEPIAKKGARITSHIALPGRFLVFMPTVNHVGVSRKIASDEERQRLKRILISEKGDFSGGFIVRTAAENASEEDLRADLRFLINLWSEIKQRSDSGKAPALIYHDLNLIERILRDQVSSNFSTIWVDSEAEYERILRFLHRFQPALVRRVKLYTKETPLFEQFGIQEEITKALKSKVWLKSGGSIVINQTEALVAIDINTGKYVGKTARLEDTIVKTNLDAIPEIVRQIRLRDLGGIIVIDFIDMDDRRNRNKVLAALEEALKADRAPSKVLQFNDFGLVAITRKRVKQSLERTLSVTCEICTGTGMVKSPITVCNEIYTEMRKMQKHFDRGDVMLRVNPEVVKQLKLNNGKWITELEEMIAKTIIIKSDPALHPEQFDIH